MDSPPVLAGPNAPPIAWDDADAAEQNKVHDQFALPPGLVIAEKYKIVSELGRGGMGAVYLVDHLFLQTQLALKTINPTKTNENSLTRFQKEARAASLLDHPGLVKVHEFGTVGALPYFVMDLVRGESLADRLKKSGPLPLETALHMLIQVSLALGYAHEKGVIHRDLKPSNIMLPSHATGEQQIKIVDFGIAKVLNDTADSVTKTGEVFGSPLYMSPEQCLGQDVDQRSDIYSLGCVAFEALTGLPPFLSDSALYAMLKHQNEVPPTLKEATLGKHFPPDLERIIAKLLDKEPSHRYQNLYSLAGDLNKIKMGLDVDVSQARKTVAAAKPALKPPTVVRLEVAILMAVAAAGLALGAGKFIWSDESTARKTNSETKKVPALGYNVGELLQPKTEPNVVRPNKPYSEIFPSGQRVYKFPNQYSLGMISVRGGGPKARFRVENSRWLVSDAKAQGTIVQEQFEPINLRLNFKLINHPEVLLGFRSDEIFKLSLTAGTVFDERKKNGSTDSTLTYLDKLTSLQILQINDGQVSDASIDIINKLPNLDSLHLHFTEVTESGALKLRRLMKFSSIEVSGMQLKPANASGTTLLKKLAKSPVLTRIKLKDCKLTDAQIAILVGNHHLTEVTLTNNPKLTVKTVKLLATLPKLEHVSLDGDSSIGPECSAELAKLDPIDLRLSNVGWKEQQLAALRKAMPKSKIELHQDRFGEVGIDPGPLKNYSP